MLDLECATSIVGMQLTMAKTSMVLPKVFVLIYEAVSVKVQDLHALNRANTLRNMAKMLGFDETISQCGQHWNALLDSA